MGLARAVLTRCMPSGAFACRGAGGGRGRTERDSLQRRRGQENAGSAPSPRHGWHPDLPVRHARAPFESMPSVVGRTQSAVDEREFDLCGRKQGGSDLGQLALQRLLSASGHASGCGEPRPASANQPLRSLRSLRSRSEPACVHIWFDPIAHAPQLGQRAY